MATAIAYPPTDRLLAAIVESSDDAIVSKTLDGVVISWNRGAEVMFGYTEEEMVGHKIHVLFPPDLLDEEERILAALHRGERIDHYETVRRHRDGHLLDVSLSVSPLHDQRGRVIGAAKIVRDITARKRAEADLREALARLQGLDALKTDLLNTVSHELRTPLTPLALQVDLLRARLPPGETHALDVIDRNLTRLTTLVDAMVDVARIRGDHLALGLAPLDLAALAMEAAAAYREVGSQRGIRVEASPGPPVEVRGDEERLRQVLDNLLTNALKFTPPGGTVAVSVVREAGEAVVRVRDTGVGLTPEQAAKLFQPFSQAHDGRAARPGTGLGLYISKGIVERHEGHIWVESEGPALGSTFAFALPVA